MTEQTLPDQFFVYFQQRKAKTDPYSCLVLIERDIMSSDPSVVHIKYQRTYPDVYELKGPITNTQGTYFGFYTLMGPADSTAPMLLDMARECKGIVIIRKGTTTRIPVFKFHDIAKRFNHVLKRNVTIHLASPLVTHPAPALTPALALTPAPAPAPAPGPAPTAPATATAPAAQPISNKKVAPTVLKLAGLHPFVAKQLLELAQIKKEMCPITAEEYITGETAAMPCGHLFMKIAIKETFKKEPGRCPACRQEGQPTYV